MPRRKAIEVRKPLARIVRDSRDHHADYMISADRAQQLYREGKLGYSDDVRGYCHLKNDPHQPKLS